MFRTHHVTQCYINVLAIWNLCADSFAEFLVCLQVVSLSVFCSLKARSRNACQHSVFAFATKHDIAFLRQRTKYFLCTLSVVPQVLAVVDIIRNLQSHFFCNGDSLMTYICQARSKSCVDTRPVENISIFKYFFPIYHARFQFRESRTVAVVNHFRVTHGSGFFHIISTKTFTSDKDILCTDIVRTEFRQTSFSQRIVGQTSDIIHVSTKVCDRDGYVGFATSIAY